jgi:fatty acid desaturase
VAEISWVTQAGAIELAFGALSGWIIALSVDKPEVLRRRGVRAIPRLRQAHIDFILMGIILIALGLAAPDLPLVWQVLLVAGAWVNPALFVPLAFDPDQQRRPLYRAATALSFASMSAGTVAAAVWLL